MLAESLACGTPVVARRAGAIPEVVDRAGGRSAVRGRAAELAGAMLDALELAGEPGTAAACRDARRGLLDHGLHPRLQWTLYDELEGCSEGTRLARAKDSGVKSTGTAALTLSAEIRSRFDEFSRSQKDVGQYIVDHLDEASFHTAEELARRANTSSSTVVRFAQALGFEGFPELHPGAGEEYRRIRDGEDGGVVDVANPPLFPIDQTEFEASLAADHTNVEDTARKVDREEVEACIDLMSHAERIVLCGTDQMAFFATRAMARDYPCTGTGPESVQCPERKR